MYQNGLVNQLEFLGLAHTFATVSPSNVRNIHTKPTQKRYGYLSRFVKFTSLVPRPRPAFCRLQYGKAWRAWYLFSREHDVIGKWRKFPEQTGCVSSIVQPTTHSTLDVYDNRPPLARYLCATLARFAVLGPLHPRTIKPFLPSFLSRRHSREKRYQALSRFTVLIATESWVGPGNEAKILLS